MQFAPRGILLRNDHISTIVPNLFRKSASIPYKRRRIETKDGDFFDIDELISTKNQKTAVLLHGLEGSSRAQYITKLAIHLFSHGHNICAMNFRSCSGEMNRTPYLYHSGETNDLRDLIKNHLPEHELYIVGFSLGGNVLLKYLGEESIQIDNRIKKTVAVSVPIDLTSSSIRLSRRISRGYSLNFMRTLKLKVRHIKNQYGKKYLQDVNENRLFTFPQFDEFVTAPLHGFSSAQDYWTKASSLPYLKHIQVATTLINAKNDPFLGENCFPEESRLANQNLTLHYPKYGGHVGFVEQKINDTNIIENYVVEFFNF